MKKTCIFLMSLLLLLQVQGQTVTDSLVNKLYGLTSISDVKPLDNTVGYASKLVMKVHQPLSHANPEKGYFDQRIVVMHRGYDRPTLLVTEGYTASYALNPHYNEELARMFNANIIIVEHRFFDESTPSPCLWEYMTDRNAMGDLHRVVTIFKNIYANKWLSSGISKGGQTCMEFRAFYPNDIDVSVPYVGPLCYGVEDGRHEPFLTKNGTAEDRRRILEFQKEVLRRKAQLLPEFEAFCLKKNLKFRVPMRDIFDYCVLEYSFAHWQWGTPTEQIPASTSSNEVMLQELLKIAGPDYFMPDVKFTPFFYQAAYELGYYGYDIRPFKNLLSIKSSRDYLHRVMLPDSLSGVKYHKELSRTVRKFLRKNDPQMVFIYGEIDPWTAAGVTWIKNKKNIHVYVQPGGSHLARISNMPEPMRQEIIDLISKWLGIPANKDSKS